MNTKRTEARRKGTSNNVAYADESGTSGLEKCYTIGTLIVPEEKHADFVKEVEGLVTQHGVVGEVKWKKVSNSHGLINFGIDVLRKVLSSNCRFSAIVVQKALYKKWQNDQEGAFYTTYCELFRHAADGLGRTVQVYIDDRSDSYDKQDEVLEIITNHMLNRLCSSGRLSNVSKADSRENVCLQVVDFITGAINTAHHKYLNPNWSVSAGKLLFISRMARALGWDRLVYDTYPNTDFNIWHFPIEWRAVPATENVRLNLAIPFVTPEELRANISDRPEN